MVTIEWVASPVNDTYADAVLSAVLQVKGRMPSTKFNLQLNERHEKSSNEESLYEKSYTVGKSYN